MIEKSSPRREKVKCVHQTDRRRDGDRAAHDDTLAWMIFHAVAVGMPKFIVLSGDERLDRFHVHFLKPCQFTQFQNPVALQFFRRGLVSRRQALNILLKLPLVRQRGDRKLLRYIENGMSVPRLLLLARRGGTVRCRVHPFLQF